MNKLLGLYWKSRFKMNNYAFFYLFMSSSIKMLKWLKITKNVPKCPAFDSIQQYSTLFDFKKGICFVCKTNRLACFNPIRVPNSKTYTKYFGIIFLNRIIRPSLLQTYSLSDSMAKKLG